MKKLGSAKSLKANEKKHYKQYKQKKVWVTVLAGASLSFLGTVATLPVMSNPASIIAYAAEESSILPNTDLNDLSGWDPENSTAGNLGKYGTTGTAGYSPIQTSNGTNINISALGKGNGILEMRIGSRVEFPGSFYNGGVRTQTTTVLAKGNIYKYSFTSQKMSGVNVPFKTRVRNVNADGSLGDEKRLRFDGKNVSTKSANQGR